MKIEKVTFTESFNSMKPWLLWRPGIHKLLTITCSVSEYEDNSGHKKT